MIGADIIALTGQLSNLGGNLNTLTAGNIL